MVRSRARLADPDNDAPIEQRPLGRSGWRAADRAATRTAGLMTSASVTKCPPKAGGQRIGDDAVVVGRCSGGSVRERWLFVPSQWGADVVTPHQRRRRRLFPGGQRLHQLRPCARRRAPGTMSLMLPAGSGACARWWPRTRIATAFGSAFAADGLAPLGAERDTGICPSYPNFPTASRRGGPAVPPQSPTIVSRGRANADSADAGCWAVSSEDNVCRCSDRCWRRPLGRSGAPPSLQVHARVGEAGEEDQLALVRLKPVHRAQGEAALASGR